MSEEIVLERAQGLLLVANTPKGRGVFATQDIAAGTIIDTCPVLVIEAEENKQYLKKTALHHYTYNWPQKGADSKVSIGQAVVFGLGSLFNHSVDQNIGWERDFYRLLVVYKSLRDIKAGEELCISYGSRLTFKDVESKGEDISEGDGSQILSNIQLDS